MKPLSNKTLETSKIIFLSLLLGLGINYIFAAPPTPPICPNNVDGCNAPLNVGYTSQIKQGNLDIKGLTSAGVSAVNGLIVENGNVGIGIPTPIRALQVNGELSVTRSDKNAYFNVSDPSGNGGGSIILRGLDSAGTAETNANVYVVGNLNVSGNISSQGKNMCHITSQQISHSDLNTDTANICGTQGTENSYCYTLGVQDYCAISQYTLALGATHSKDCTIGQSGNTWSMSIHPGGGQQLGCTATCFSLSCSQ